MKPEVTIFIPTKNAGSEFRITLNKVFDQTVKNIELIIIDSGSRDKTLDIAECYPAKIIEIEPETFGHGKTRNLALEYASADFIVFLSQDAIPYDEYWLSNLLKNFDEDNIAAVFSRQLPRKEAKQLQRFFYQYYFPDSKISRPQRDFNSSQNRFFSNVSSCVKRGVLEKYPFDETILTTEDQEWAHRIIKKGFKTIYEPESIVIHSHNHGLAKTFKGYFDSAFALSGITQTEYDDFKKSSQQYLRKEFHHVLKNKPTELPYWLARNIVKVLGIFLGLRGNKLTLNWKKRLSLNKNYWK